MKSSTKATPANPTAAPTWRAAGLRYYAYSHYLTRRFGGRVQKVSIDAGFTCPNVDGTVATGGCTFCDNRSFSPSRRLPRLPVREQLAEGIRRLQRRYQCDRFLAYFQPATNTYAPPERLRKLYAEALDHPAVVGLVVGTRPDCVPEPVLELLEELASQTYVAVEYGLQTIHARSLEWMNRGHGYAEFEDAVRRSLGRGFYICAHVILGLPGESAEDMLATARAVASSGIDAVKIHNLYVVKNTRLADEYLAGKAKLLSREEFVRALVDFLELLPEEMVVERISGEAPSDFFLAPSWALDKPGLLAAVREEMVGRDTWQGKGTGASGC